MPSNEPIGTTHSHYAPPKDGPFMCEYCVHFTDPHFCLHPDVIKDAQAGELKLGKRKGGECAIVAADGCCNYFRNG